MRNRTGRLAILLGICLCVGPAFARDLTLEDRIDAQKAIERVFWSHRIWPKENPKTKPPLSAVMPDSAIRARVEEYLRKSNALEKYWHRPITAKQLQAELDRMARNTRDPKFLQELFDALRNNAFLVAETLARQTLVDRLVQNWFDTERGRQKKGRTSFEAWWTRETPTLPARIETDSGPFVLPAVALTGCANDSWIPTHSEVPDLRLWDSVVWTGTEMIVWGGHVSHPALNTGGKYNPATDTWTSTSVGANVPSARDEHTAIWTGSEMIVWGGSYYDVAAGVTRYFNDGGRYDPITDVWTPISTGPDAPTARSLHTAVWTGTEMIVWGGRANSFVPNTGGRYNPATDRWAATSTGPNTPQTRFYHTAVWTGREMIVWGGLTPSFFPLNTGGRYDPVTDSWMPTSMGPNVPAARSSPTAVWTGTEMIVWGGDTSTGPTNTGARYDPISDIWTPTSTGMNVPAARRHHTAVWTGTEMIIWGGTLNSLNTYWNTGGRYDPTTDTWTPTSTNPYVPAARSEHTAVWTGSEMIVWGGFASGSVPYPYGGGRYNPMTDSWIPTGTSTTVPSARGYHSAVWTGAEMIAWGGTDITFAIVNSGGRYTPSTDSWTPTSMGANIPAAWSSQTAVWTGREMIVWGVNGNTGGRYNPLTDTWLPTSTGPNVPTAWYGHTAVWTGTEMIIWGGANANTGGRYDPSTDIWRATSTGPNAPTARSGHIAVWSGTEMIIWGGGNANTGGRYDPSTDTWAPTSTGTNVPVARSGHTGVWTGVEMIVWGGRGSGGFLDIINTGGRYNPSTDSWTPTSIGTNVPLPRHNHTAVWTGSEMIVWGGFGALRLATGGRYNPSMDSWTSTSTGLSVPGGRMLHTAVWTGTEMIVWGGDVPTSTGGRYCACPNGRLLYRDADADGYGNPGVSFPSCDASIPIGYVADDTDCNDGNSSIHPDLTEVCNGIDDDCNGTVDDDGNALCEDLNVCTDDACNGAAGCHHENNTVPCSDGNACTTDDACRDGVCVAGPPLSCEDNECCTVDSCDPATGCVNSPFTTPPSFTSQPSLAEGGTCAFIWPPQHGYVDFTISDTRAAASSACGIARIEFSSCSSNQPENANGVGDGNSTRDCVYEPGALHVRAEREGSCSPIGRVYTMTVDAVDICGNRATSRPFEVSVWHDREHGPDSSSGPVHSASPGSNQDDTRPGVNGVYGASCGAGAGPTCDGGPNQIHDSSDDDQDGDLIPNYEDNCQNGANWLQLDIDFDGEGDACDADDGLIDLVRFTSLVTLSWEPDPTAAFYNIYRGTFQNGSRFSDAACYMKTWGRPALETAVPHLNRGYFYLVTATSSAGVDSSPGYASDGSERKLTNRCP